MKLRLTLAADRDLAGIARYTLRNFGPVQHRFYAGLISHAFALLLEDPERASAHRREELGPNVRSFHLELAAQRRHGASHMIYYLFRRSGDGEGEVIILRVLGDEMEPKNRLRRALRSEG